jgi:hypothetical protein
VQTLPKLRLFSMLCWTSQVRMPPSGVWQKCLWKKCMHLGIASRREAGFYTRNTFNHKLCQFNTTKFYKYKQFVRHVHVNSNENGYMYCNTHFLLHEDITLLNQLTLFRNLLEIPPLSTFGSNLFWLKLKWNARSKLSLYRLSFLHALMKFKDIDKRVCLKAVSTS